MSGTTNSTNIASSTVSSNSNISTLLKGASSPTDTLSSLSIRSPQNNLNTTASIISNNNNSDLNNYVYTSSPPPPPPSNMVKSNNQTAIFNSFSKKEKDF